ncbi:MAG: DUF6875 domain-containing protein [Acidobacteriota bacterium]
MKPERAPQSDKHVGLTTALSKRRPSGSSSESATPPSELFRVSEIDSDKPMGDDLASLRTIVRWLRGFLANPHPELGRSGPVCPFMPKALRLDTLYLTCVRNPGGQPMVDQMTDTVRRYRDVFLNLEPRTGDEAIDKSLLMLFPDVQCDQANELIDSVQQRLKPDYTRFGLMLGEFHERNMTPGLRNPEFFPLRSPVCMLVIRHMVESDLPFLERPDDSPGARVGFLRSYLRRLGGRMSERKLDLAIDALVNAEIERRGLASAAGAPGCPVSHEPSARS